MKFFIRVIAIVLSIFNFSNFVYSQASCLNPGTLLPGCALAANLQDALTATPVGACGSATASTTYSVWYVFKAGASSQTITLAGLNSGTGASLDPNTTYLEVFSGTCGSFTPVSTCQNASSALNLTGLTIGNEYFLRIYVTSNPSANPAKRNFTITLSGPPSNDNCLNAISLSPSATCTNISGTLSGASASSPAVASTCSGTPGADVWYSFVAPSAYPTISLSNRGSNFSSSYIQLLSGACGGLTSVACANATSLTPGTAITPGNTYYIRIYSATVSPTGCNWGFDICVTYNPPPSNNDCSGATLLISATSCSTTSGTLVDATSSTGLATGCENVGTHYDVWYKFVASSSTHTIEISGVGTGITNSAIQLYSGACESLTSISCGTTSVTSSSLISSNTYYVRVSNIGAGVSSNGAFNICVTQPAALVTVAGGRTNEVFSRTILSGASVMNYPWEITYGPDNKLWITEAKGYKVTRMDPTTGSKTTVLDLNTASTDLSAWGADSLNVQFSSSQNPWPQGGLAGLAIHPQFLDGSGQHDYVYLSYVHRYLYTVTSPSAGGIYFRNKIVRFTYNSGTGKLGSPAVICDTIPGGQDHNSQRMIIAPVSPGGTNYLFYASGDMGSGQYSNRMRPMNPQNIDSYEGKILRFNLEPVAGSWIPADNPYSNTSAVYSIGIRNNQGFVYDTLTNVLYGSSHGPFSDDEINIIESKKNYGHPVVVGFYEDGNYNGITAGNAPNMSGGSTSTAPLIVNEATAASGIGSSYKNPLYSAYTQPTPVSPSNYTTMTQLWNNTTGGNNIWPSEGWSGLDLYTHTLIPGWKRSLIASGLKWGRLIRLKLGATGTTTLPSNLAYGNTGDTITYFQSTNRYRDLAFAPNGKDVFIIMDNNSATSGPGTGNPIVPACAGCVIKYSFLGYGENAGRSSIPNSIDITATTKDSITNGTIVTIDASNNTLWVPITGPDGNILAEIKANGNNLGTITSKFYTSNTVREDALKRLYLNRSITITPQNQPSSAVNVRLYFTATELTSLIGATNSQGAGSGVSSISDIKILKNDDASPELLTAAAATITPAYAEVHTGTTNGGYVVQADITSFSSFYFGDPDMIPLPVELISFAGKIRDNAALLQWETANEHNTSHFEVERSIDAQNFEKAGSVNTNNSSGNARYSFIDKDADKQASSILYYRLKIVDKDGSISYSQVISLTISPASIPVVIYPNPVNDVLNFRITMPKESQVLIQVTDMNGRVMFQQNKFIRNGTDDILINTKSWPAQSYSVIVTDSKKKILVSKKIIKM